MTTVFVTNRSTEGLEDGYAGTRYTFARGNTVEIPVDAARHIFGHGDDNKEPYLIRLGWTVTRNDLPEAIERLSKFEILEAAPMKHHSLSPVVQQVPLPARRGGGKPALASA